MTEAVDKKALDAGLVNALISATQDVIGTMANLPVSVKEIRPQPGYASTGDISAVIGIMGEGGEGMVALSFPLALSSRIVSNLLGTTPNALSSDDRCDGIGELVNMISGNAKTSLSKASGTVYKLSLPSIIQGANHEVATRPKNSPYLCIVFDIEGEQFNLQVTFKFN